MEQPDEAEVFFKERSQVKIRHFIEWGKKSMPWQHVGVNDKFEAYFWEVWNILRQQNLKINKTVALEQEEKQYAQSTELLEKLCPDFEWLNNGDDIARGYLLGKYHVYLKQGHDKWMPEKKKRGLFVVVDFVETILHLNIFQKNFNALDGAGDIEQGWCDETLLELLRYIDREFNL